MEEATELKPGEAIAPMWHDVWSTESGQINLIYPSRMSPEEYQDFKDWIALVLRKTKRNITPKSD